MTEHEKEDGRVSRAQKQREFRRQAVLGAAKVVFAQKGYRDSSIDDIILAAHIARGTFYLYFPSKRAIFDELVDGLFRTFRSIVRRVEIGPGAPPPIEQLNAIVSEVL